MEEQENKLPPTKTSEMTEEERSKLIQQLSHDIANTTLSSEKRKNAVKVLKMLTKTTPAKPKAEEAYDFDF